MITPFLSFIPPGFHGRVLFDDEDSQQFYILPDSPMLARTANGSPVFGLLLSPDAAPLNADFELAVPSADEQRVREYCRTQLARVLPFRPALRSETGIEPLEEDGTPRLAYPGWTESKATFELDSKVLIETRASNFGRNRAAFGMTLTPEAAHLVERGIKEGAPELRVRYQSKFSVRLPNFTMRLAVTARARDSYRRGIPLEQLLQTREIRVEWEESAFSTFDEQARLKLMEAAYRMGLDVLRWHPTALGSGPDAIELTPRSTIELLHEANVVVHRQSGLLEGVRRLA
jgi:hypothetical protein